MIGRIVFFVSYSWWTYQIYQLLFIWYLWSTTSFHELSQDFWCLTQNCVDARMRYGRPRSWRLCNKRPKKTASHPRNLTQTRNQNPCRTLPHSSIGQNQTSNQPLDQKTRNPAYFAWLWQTSCDQHCRIISQPTHWWDAAWLFCVVCPSTEIILPFIFFCVWWIPVIVSVFFSHHGRPAISLGKSSPNEKPKDQSV